MRIHRRALVVLAALSLLAGLPAAGAQPPPDASTAVATVNAEVMVLLATQTAGPGSIDPQIGNLPQLKKPPFSAYNTYKLLDRKGLVLQKTKPADYTMINNRVLEVTLEDVFPPVAPDPARYKLAAAINQPGGGTFLKLLEWTAKPNETFFVAGQSYSGGILVIGITVKP
jgi:hypothetical protein